MCSSKYLNLYKIKQLAAHILYIIFQIYFMQSAKIIYIYLFIQLYISSNIYLFALKIEEHVDLNLMK